MFTHRSAATSSSSNITPQANLAKIESNKLLLFSEANLLEDAVQVLRSSGLVRLPEPKVLWVHDLFRTIGIHEMQEDISVQKSVVTLAVGIASRAFTWPEYTTWALH